MLKVASFREKGRCEQLFMPWIAMHHSILQEQFQSLTRPDIVSCSAQVAVHLSFTTLRLLLRLQADILETLQLTSSQFTVKCTQFDRIWLGKGGLLMRFL